MTFAYVRALALVLLAVLALGAVVYVWQLDGDPAVYVPSYPSTTPASTSVP